MNNRRKKSKNRIYNKLKKLNIGNKRRKKKQMKQTNKRIYINLRNQRKKKYKRFLSNQNYMRMKKIKINYKFIKKNRE